MNTQPFGQTDQMIELYSEYLSVRCIWLYVLIISRTRFRVNPHSIVDWMSWLESRCTYVIFRFHACFEEGVPWHLGNYRVWIHSETRTWHDKNIQSCKIHFAHNWQKIKKWKYNKKDQNTCTEPYEYIQKIIRLLEWR